MRVLLLEDHEDAADALAAALTQLDSRYEIRRAGRLAEAQRIVATEPIDIGLIDLTLPDADGRDGALALKAINPDLPLVALTGREFDGLAVELIRSGVQDFLSKGETSVQRIHQVLQLAMERQRQERSLRYRACYDPLTGVLNQSEVRTQLGKAIGNALRAQRLGAVMVIDLDNFKSINDTYGHAAGDAVLRAVAKRLAASVRVGDSVGRMGGDEFVVVLEGVGTREHAAAAARKTSDAVRFALNVDRAVVAVSASIGIALFPTQASDAHNLLKLADQAMYAAKRMGKGRYCFFSEGGESQMRAAKGG